MTVIKLDNLDYLKPGTEVKIFRPFFKTVSLNRLVPTLTVYKATVLTPVFEMWLGERVLENYAVELEDGEQLNLAPHNVHHKDVDASNAVKCHDCAGWGDIIHGDLSLEAVGIFIPAGKKVCSFCNGSGFGFREDGFFNYPPEYDKREGTREWLEWIKQRPDKTYRTLEQLKEKAVNFLDTLKEKEANR